MKYTTKQITSNLTIDQQKALELMECKLLDLEADVIELIESSYNVTSTPTGLNLVTKVNSNGGGMLQTLNQVQQLVKYFEQI